MSIYSDADPHYSQVVLLLNGNGATIVDDSIYARVPTSTGGVVTTTSQKKFGGGSLNRASGNTLVYPSSSDFTLGTGDFTVEFYRYIVSNAGTAYNVARANGASAGRWALGESGADKLSWFYLGSAYASAPSVSTTGVWQHCAYSRSGGTAYLSQDGVIVLSGADTNDYSDTSALSLFGDASSGTLSSSGTYLDFVRVTVGVGRYTADFTPPVEASNRLRFLLSSPITPPQIVGGGRIDAAAPLSSLQLYGGWLVDIAAPSPAVAASFGGQATLAAPSPTVSFIAHDASDDNAMRLGPPSPELEVRGGMAADLTAPMQTASASMTGTSLMDADLIGPAPAVSVVGTVSAMLQAALRGPSPTVSAFGGARVVATAPVGTVLIDGTVGGTSVISAVCPMFDVTATITAQAYMSALLRAPSPTLNRESIASVLVGPSPVLTFSGYAVVAATYEAFATNLKHTGLRPGQTEIDEVTRYTNFPFTHIIRFGNSYFGVGSLGLYLLGGTTDYASPTPTPVAWAIKTGATDFGRQEHKTIDSVIFGGRMPAEATITMYAGEAAGTAYAYTTPRGALAQNYRMKPGKGLVSRYYAFGASGAGTFFLDTLTPDVAVLKRRI